MEKAFFFFLLLILSGLLTAQPPTITKIEPPNWWVGMQWNTVQLMLHGDYLDGITAEVRQEGLNIKAVHTLPNDAYAFIDLEIAETLAPGTYPITITRNGQSATVNYTIEERPDPAGKHLGFDQYDAVYLITPDRFANGDPSNDRVAGMLDEFDRSVDGKRHGGDLKGIIDRLDYLEDLGVTTLWLNPMLENSGRGSYHGYAATDLYKVDARLGTNEDYKKLVEECHKRGMKVIFDKNKRIKQALTILMTTRGIPQILYATEINMKGGRSHVELRADFPGGWEEDKRNAFTADGRTEEENDLFDFTRQLLNVRKKHKELVDGRFIQYSPTYRRNVYKYLKIGKEHTCLILINGHEEEREVDLSALSHHLKGVKSFQNLINGEKLAYDQSGKIRMEGLGTLILQLSKAEF